MKNNNMFDFKVKINENRDFKILQLTDFQPIDPLQKRYPERLCVKDSVPLTEERKYKNLFYYIETLINENKPDLIIITGDQVYGEFDDNGSNFLEIINFIDKFNIPWAPVYGNHDAESKKGVAWQCKQYESMKNCLFKRRELTGNGNYSIGLYRQDKLIRVLYMLDSNGCGHAKHYSYCENYPLYNADEHVEEKAGIYQDQIDWIDESCNIIDNEFDVKKFVAFHIPPSIMRKTAYLNKYQSTDEWGNEEHFVLGKDIEPLNNDFGTKGEKFHDCPTLNLWEVLKKHNFTNLFVGHCHKNTLVMMCDGIRVSYGVKTGVYDYHENVGGTLISITKDDKVDIEHKFLDII